MRPNRQIRSGALYPVLILVLIGTMAAWAANTEVALFDIRLPRITATALVGWVGLVIPMWLGPLRLQLSAAWWARCSWCSWTTSPGVCSR